MDIQKFHVRLSHMLQDIELPWLSPTKLPVVPSVCVPSKESSHFQNIPFRSSIGFFGSTNLSACKGNHIYTWLPQSPRNTLKWQTQTKSFKWYNGLRVFNRCDPKKVQRARSCCSMPSCLEVKNSKLVFNT